MKSIVLSAGLFVAAAFLASAQTLSFGFGDAEIDASLNDLNASAQVDIAGFTADVTVQWGVPAVQVTAASAQGLQPAEVFVAASLAKASGKSLDQVVAEFKKNKKAGWGALAKSLGVKPGSPAFKALKDKSKASAEKARSKAKSKEGGKK